MALLIDEAELAASDFEAWLNKNITYRTSFIDYHAGVMM